MAGVGVLLVVAGAALGAIRGEQAYGPPAQQLMPADGSDDGSSFGASVALAADGATAVIGGPSDTTFRGAAWIFARGASWGQQGGKLVGSDIGEGGADGRTVAVSPDGTAAAAGAPQDGGGAVWFYARTADGWHQVGAKVAPTGEEASGFGAGVAFSRTGSLAVVGGPQDGDGAGAVWTFARTPTGWVPQGAKLTPAGSSGGSGFGTSVAISADGTTLLVGAVNDFGRGSAYVFTRSGTAWVQQGQPLAPRELFPYANFGTDVALSGDGGTAIVGAPNDNNDAGGAWVFTRTGTAWNTQGTRLLPLDASGQSQFGTAVAISADGIRAVVGGPADEDGRGSAWAFIRSGTSWAKNGAKLTPAPVDDSAAAGTSVAISSGGGILLVGGPDASEGFGRVWAFVDPAAPISASAPPANFRLLVVRRGAGTVVTTPGGISCGAKCAAQFARGVSVRLVARPAPKWRFVRWGGLCPGTRPVCVVRMNQAVRVLATFARR